MKFQNLKQAEKTSANFIAVLIIILILNVGFISSQSLTWDNTKNNISSTYDAKNRVLTKGDIQYTYDLERNDTLTNISNPE